MAVSIIDASEARFGPIDGTNRTYKAFVFRLKAVELLIDGKEDEADKWWAKMKAIDEDLYGSLHSGKPAMHGSTDTEDKLLKLLGSWAPLRHDGWAAMKAALRHKGMQSSDVASFIGGMDANLKNVATAHADANLTGLNHWQRWFPPNSDILAHLKRSEDPNVQLAELEAATDTGNWVEATYKYHALYKKAVEEQKFQQAMDHADELISLYRNANPPDKDMIKKLQNMKMGCSMAVQAQGLLGEADTDEWLAALEEKR
jgi:hypothetical protein